MVDEITFNAFVSAIPGFRQSIHYGDSNMLAALDHDGNLTVYTFGAHFILRHDLGRLDIMPGGDAMSLIEIAVMEWAEAEQRND